jgi:hypothetical protein
LIRDKIYVQTGVIIMGWIEGIGEAINYIEENITEEIPQFWTEHYQTGNGEFVCGMY